ncbi:hypothetical protein AeRB84_012564 [Aphanomyces euteiches]|nr:hypothetical protein AeRB84_012564 [Aphanomyces euteiches]
MNDATTPPAHRYNTRSSPSPPPPHANQLYRFRADVIVKETVYGRDHNGKRLQPQVFEGSSWEAIKERIFEFSRANIVSMANYTSDPREWSVSTDVPTVLDFESFITIKMGRNQFKPTSITQAHQYLVDYVERVFTVVIFKWGNKINSAADLQEFNRQCVAPQNQDRAGAAAEALHQQTVQELKTQWNGFYTAYESTWRMWAAHILKRPTHEDDVLVTRPPPVHMIHLFESAPNSAQTRNESLQRSLTLAQDVVDSCLEDINVLMKDAETLVLRAKSCFEMLQAKKSIIGSFTRELAPYNSHLEDAEHDEEQSESELS